MPSSRHGPLNTGGFDRNGHFGAISGCAGRVIHQVEGDDVVLSAEEMKVEIEEDMLDES